jgi:hypothetical protein
MMEIQNNKNKILIFAMLFLAIFIFPQNVSARASSYGLYLNPADVDIGDGINFILFSKAGITSTSSTFEGNIGVSPAGAATMVGVTSCAAFVNGAPDRMYTITAAATPVGCVTTPGTVTADNALMNSVKTDTDAAYADARNLATHPANEAVAGAGGMTGEYGRGVYTYGGATSVGALITIKGSGSDIFIFAITGAYTQPVAGSFQLKNDSDVIGGANGPHPENIFWAIDGAISVATNINFVGTVMATGAMPLAAGVDFSGRAFTNGSITVPTTTVSMPASSSPPSGTTIQPMLITKAQIVNFPN